MTRAMVMGNWKMNLDYVEAIHLVQQLGVLLRSHSIERTDVVVAPPFVDLRSVTSIIEADRLPIFVAGQHAHFADAGALTGEISVAMLKRLGVKFVIVGHSERRTGFSMTDDVVRLTVDAVVSAGITAVLCCGEDGQTRESGDAAAFVTQQIVDATSGLHDKYADKLIVAYEPIWAIGSGQAADTETVRSMIETIRRALPESFGEATRVLYGGSVSADNSRALLTESGADGFLVGGASLRAEEFVGIVVAVDDCYR